MTKPQSQKQNFENGKLIYIGELSLEVRLYVQIGLLIIIKESSSFFKTFLIINLGVLEIFGMKLENEEPFLLVLYS